MFLYNPKKAACAHVWTGRDTACKMYRTGGLSRRANFLFDDRGNRPVCKMCMINMNKHVRTDDDMQHLRSILREPLTPDN